MRKTTINLQALLTNLQKNLQEIGDETPGNTSLVLLSHILDKPKSWLLAHGEYLPSPEEIQTLHSLKDQYVQGFPLPYILGYWEFYGRTFKVTPDVLIPRPETELLVEKAITSAQKIKKPILVDVGTGSGAIAISLSAELPSATIVAADLSWKALRLAKQNAFRLNQPRIMFVQADLLTPLHQKFDIICANLPYIPRQKLVSLKVSHWEPQLALDGGESGLDLIDALLRLAQNRLASPGKILLEIESSLGKDSLSAARKAFPNARHRLYSDLQGQDRILEIYQE